MYRKRRWGVPYLERSSLGRETPLSGKRLWDKAAPITRVLLYIRARVAFGGNSDTYE